MNTVDFSYAMKELYMGPINDQTYRSRVLLNRLEKNSKDVSGLYAYVPVMSARNPAVGSRKEMSSTDTSIGAKLPQPGRQTYKALTFPMGQHYGRCSVSGSAIRRSRDPAGAFAKALQQEMEGLMESLPDDLNRQVCGYGLGRAATLANKSQTITTTFEVDARDPFTARVGDNVVLVDITAGTIKAPTVGNGVVSAIAFNQDATGDYSSTVHYVTITGNSTGVACVTGAVALYYGSAASASAATAADWSRGQDIYGIGALVDDGAIGADLQDPGEDGEPLGAFVRGTGQAAGDKDKVGGITRATEAWLQSTVKHNPASAGTERPLTETVMQEAWLTAVAQNGAAPDALEAYMGPATWGTLGMLQVGGRTYNDFKDTVEMGFSYINFNGTKCFYDRDIHEGEMFFISMKNMFLLTQNGYEFLDDDGNVVRMVAGGGYDAWEFAINRDVQLGYNNGRVHTKLKDLTRTMTVNGQLH